MRSHPTCPAEVEAVEARSVAGALLAKAHEIDASHIVLGSASGVIAQVMLGTNACRILRHAPVPAVVVPA